MNHDISHCTGISENESICNQCAQCQRYRAHIEAVELKLEYVCYIEVPKDATPHHCLYHWDTDLDLDTDLNT